jgi:ribosomal protein S18 acetylase RimI-like enzyme
MRHTRGTEDIDRSLVWRTAFSQDNPFLLSLMQVTMRGYIFAATGMSEEEQKGYLTQRCSWFAWEIASLNGEDVGALACQVKDGTLWLESIHVRPEWQGSGIGSAMLRRVMADAARQNLPIRLHVFKANPAARRFYERHGFILEEETPVNYAMLLTTRSVRMPMRTFFQKLRSFFEETSK